MNLLTRSLRPLLWFAGLLLLAGLLAVLLVSGPDRWFRQAVPIDQRVVSHNEDIRKKAQQELLGLSTDAKRHVAEKLALLLDDHDHLVQKWAAISIALIGPPAQDTIPALLRGVSSPENDVVQACRVALSEIGTPDPDQLPPLMQAMGDTREAVRCEAAASIARMGASAANAIPLMVRQLETPNAVPECLSTAIAEFVVAEPDAATPLIALTAQPSVEIRRHAAAVMALIGARSPIVVQSDFQVYGQESDDEIRQSIAKALDLKHVTDDRGPSASLITILRRSRNETVREMALEALKTQTVSWDDLKPAVVHALHDRSPEVRVAALNWLHEAEAPPHYVVGELIPLFQDDDVRVRRLALQVLQSIDSRREDLLVPVARAQRDDDPDIRCLAAEQLVEMHASDRVAVALLARDLKNPDEDTCAQDALGLAGHFNGDVVPAMIRLLADPRRETRRRAALVLIQLGSKAKDALPALAQAEKDGIPGAANAFHVIHAASVREARARHRRS